MNTIRHSGQPLAIVVVTVGSIGSLLWLSPSTSLAGEETYPAKVADESPIDHSALDGLLLQHVQDGWVDYAGLKPKEPELATYLKTLADIKPTEHSRNELLAMYINAYNAATLKLILEHYPGLKSIKDIPDKKRWKAKRWLIAGERLSLDGLEHQVLRVRFAEPRIHFAINCASIGCPPLRSEAYVAARLNEQLQAQAEYIHRKELWVRLAGDGSKVLLTPFYDWFKSDFEANGHSVLEYAARFSPDLERSLQRQPAPEIEYLSWDWNLNGK